MPYVDKAGRANMDAGYPPETPGELNYAITKVCTTYLTRKGVGYITMNDIMGALEGAKLEFYRRVAAPYEDRKKAENGDVYPTG